MELSRESKDLIDREYEILKDIGKRIKANNDNTVIAIYLKNRDNLRFVEDDED